MLPLLLVPALLAAPPADGPGLPAAFLAKVPAVPRNLQALAAADQAAFQEQVRQALEWQDGQIERVRKAQKGAEKAAADNLKARVGGGGAKVSKEEKAKVRAMTQQEKMAWAMGKMNSVDPAALEQAMAGSAQAAQAGEELAGEIPPRIQRAGSFDARYEALRREFDTSSRSAGLAYSAAARTVTPEVARAFLPRYQAILAEHLAAIKAALPDYQRLAGVRAKAANAAPDGAVSVDALEAIRGYTRRVGAITGYLPVK